MLKDCIEIFEKEIENYKKNNPNGDEISFITDSYTLTTGSYYLLDIETGDVLKQLDVDKNTDKTTDLYYEFAGLRYISSYLNSDKAIGQLKNILSNNIYSFIVKKENIYPNKQGIIKITDEYIDKYYNAILNFSTSSTLATNKNEKETKKIFIEYEKINGKTNANNAEKAKNLVKTFLEKNNFSETKGQLAIFFNVSFSEYEKESLRYIKAKIYNKNEYNYLKNNKTFGLPDNNMGANSDKPYLKNKTRKKDLPYAISQDEVLVQKLFFDDLKNKVKNSESITKKNDITHYYMHLTTDNGEPIIDDYSIICNDKKFKIPQNNYLNNDDNYKYSLKDKDELFKDIDEYLYDFNLKKYIYKLDINIKEYSRLTQNIKFSNKAWGDWLYKNNYRPIKAILNKVFIPRILDTLIEPPKDCSTFYQISNKAALRFNIFYSIERYFLRKETEEMPEEFIQIYEKIKEKINSKETQCFENDKEAFFAMGQLEYYFVYKKKNNTKHDEAIPFLTSVYSKNAKNEIFKLFKIRSYDIPLNWKKFNNLYAMIQEYDYPEKMDIKSVLAGYLHSCILLENSKDEDTDNIE